MPHNIGSSLKVGLDTSLEFTSIEGDLSKDDEARLIEELENAREEIKNIKMRQASHSDCRTRKPQNRLETLHRQLQTGCVVLRKNTETFLRKAAGERHSM